MILRHVELLRIQRDLHDIPRGMERFGEYLRTMVGDAGDIDLVPLGAMNPMGREHVAERLDELLAMGAEQAAAQATQDASRMLETWLPSPPHAGGRESDSSGARAGDSASRISFPTEYRHGLVVADDLKGGWTNRHLTEAGGLLGDLTPGLKRGWVSTILWVSDAAHRESVREHVLFSAARAAVFLECGVPKTLRQTMHQYGAAARFAGLKSSLDEDDIDYTLEVLEPLMGARDYPTLFAAMYGDEVAKQVGYAPLGLSHRAGFEAAIARCGPKQECPVYISSYRSGFDADSPS